MNFVVYFILLVACYFISGEVTIHNVVSLAIGICIGNIIGHGASYYVKRLKNIIE